ncbi:MAG: hypothetical protein M1821_008217 [Bathelium mastoideum]|nr:MAG: hypothetical protein M1821_008217 [Bathelium mastoideum]
MAGHENYYGMSYPPPPSDYQSSGPIPQGPSSVHAGMGGAPPPKHHKHHDSGYDRYGGANQYPPQEPGSRAQYPPSSAYPTQPPPQNYAQNPYAQAEQPPLEPPYSRETRHSPAAGYETALAPYQPPEPEWDDQPQYQYPPQAAGQHGYPPPGYGGHPPPLSSGYDDDYDSHDEKRRHRHRREGSDSRHSKNDGGDDGGKEKKKKGLSDKEKGLGASLLGGAGGAFVGHEMGGGALGTILGIGAGAIGAALLEKDHEKQKKKEKERDREKRLKYRDDFEYGSSDVGSAGQHRRDVSPPRDDPYGDERYQPHDRDRRRRSRSRGRGDDEDNSSSDSEYERRRH